jgi:subtilase family serine protease
MEHLQLLLKRPVERQRALERYTEEVQDPRSSSFHHWLTPAELTQRFGLAQHDINAITSWLTEQGFKVNAVNPGAPIIDFSGTARDVQRAFHTEIHYIEVGGQRHIANMTDPAIPAALAPAVAGIVSLNDLRPHPQ